MKGFLGLLRNILHLFVKLKVCISRQRLPQELNTSLLHIEESTQNFGNGAFTRTGFSNQTKPMSFF